MFRRTAVNGTSGFVALSLLCGMTSVPMMSGHGDSSVRKGDLLRPLRSAAKATIASYSVTRGDGRQNVVMRLQDGREAYRVDQELAFTAVGRNVDLPGLPDVAVVATASSSIAAPAVRRASPIGCERALSGLVKASAISQSRCLT